MSIYSDRLQVESHITSETRLSDTRVVYTIECEDCEQRKQIIHVGMIENNKYLRSNLCPACYEIRMEKNKPGPHLMRMARNLLDQCEEMGSGWVCWAANLILVETCLDAAESRGLNTEAERTRLQKVKENER